MHIRQVSKTTIGLLLIGLLLLVVKFYFILFIERGPDLDILELQRHMFFILKNVSLSI